MFPSTRMGTSRRTSTSARLALETLEDRCVPANFTEMVYLLNNDTTPGQNAVLAFRHNANGSLTQVGAFPTGGTGLANPNEIVGTDGVIRNVNSYHRWAAREVTAPLEVTASCGDVIEAIRHRDARVQGIMWHPEREADFDPVDVRAVRELLGGGAA